MIVSAAERKAWLPGGFYWALLILVVMALGSLLAVRLCASHPLYDHYPYTSVFFDEHYPDLLLFSGRFQFYHSAGFFTYPAPTRFMYPAPNATVYEGLYRLAGVHPVRWFFALACMSYLAAGAVFVWALARRGVSFLLSIPVSLLTLVCSYPIWFELRQANIEVAVWVLIAGGIGLFLLQRPYAAAICFCLAASMKIYPVIFLGLLLKGRQYRAMAAGLVAAALATVASVWMLCPAFGYCWGQIRAGLDQFRTTYMLQVRPESGMDHSLFGLIKLMWQPLPPPVVLGRYLTVYLAVAAVAGTLLFFVRIRHLPVWNQVTCLVVACIWLPPTSFEYTLQHLLVPFALLVLLAVDAARVGQRVSGFRWLFLCFAFLLSAMPQVIRHGIRYDGPIKSVLLFLLFAGAVRWPMQLQGGTDEESAVGETWWERSRSRRDHTLERPAASV